MSTLHGIIIADPAKRNIKFSSIERDQFDVSRKQPGRPLQQFVSEQETLNNFPEFMVSGSQYSINETTIPMTVTTNNEMLNQWAIRRKNLKADVEKPQLEADKYLVDEGMNNGAWFNPSGNYPAPTFKQVDRPVLRTVRNPATRFSQAHVFAKAANFLYVKGEGNYQNCYYKNNPRKDSKGRIHLFERSFTRIWA
jgi:hypothetical protein